MLPKISVVIPTLNAAQFLTNCLQSIRSQNYPQSRIEIILADGGSTDDTLNIAQKFNCQVYPNPLLTAESGKTVGIKHATGKYIALIDSDNFLPDVNWLQQMLIPFSSSPQIIGSEPIKFIYRREAGFIERYSALLGANDPYAYFLGNYDRLSHLSGQWTDLNIPITSYPEYLLLTLKPNQPLPTIGANGTIFRAEFLKNNLFGDYLFDIDILSFVIQKTQKPLYFAKVNNGIIHTYCESSISKFIRKQTRRVKDIFFYQSLRRYPWQKSPFYFKNILFPLYSLSIVLPLIDALKGYLKTPDFAWFFHPLACLITTSVYSVFSTIHLLGLEVKQSRHQWRQ